MAWQYETIRHRYLKYKIACKLNAVCRIKIQLRNSEGRGFFHLRDLRKSMVMWKNGEKNHKTLVLASFRPKDKSQFS